MEPPKREGFGKSMIKNGISGSGAGLRSSSRLTAFTRRFSCRWPVRRLGGTNALPSKPFIVLVVEDVFQIAMYSLQFWKKPGASSLAQRPWSRDRPYPVGAPPTRRLRSRRQSPRNAQRHCGNWESASGSTPISAGFR